MFQGQTSLGGERLVSTTTTTPPTKPAALSAAKQALEKETAALHIPICGILAGGDRCSLHQVFAVMTSNHCPMVVIRCYPLQRGFLPLCCLQRYLTDTFSAPSTT
uniref:Usp domain-containing protein n=1 Tax=Mesocestoides corti TaxID=53468 RepID=A0A5K3FUG7_MESCO